MMHLWAQTRCTCLPWRHTPAESDRCALSYIKHGKTTERFPCTALLRCVVLMPRKCKHFAAVRASGWHFAGIQPVLLFFIFLRSESIILWPFPPLPQPSPVIIRAAQCLPAGATAGQPPSHLITGSRGARQQHNGFINSRWLRSSKGGWSDSVWPAGGLIKGGSWGGGWLPPGQRGSAAAALTARHH